MAVTISWQDSHIIKMTYEPSKLGQTAVVFGLWSQFISRSFCACLSAVSSALMHATQRKVLDKEHNERNVIPMQRSGQWHGWNLSRDMACV